MAINPFQQPINYTAQMVDLNPAFQGLGQAFRGLGESRQQQERLAQAQAAKQQFELDLQKAQTDGTQAAWTGMIARYPQFREAFGDVRKNIGEERVKGEFTQGFNWSTALENNRPDIVIQGLATTIQAKKNSGEPADTHEQALELLESGEPVKIKQAQSILNGYLATLDPDRFEKSVKARQSLPLGEASLRESIAKADKAVADATTAQATATNAPEKAAADAAKAKADAEKARVEAQYAEGVAKDAIKKRAADLGLTTNQANQALAATRKLGVETQKAALELAALKATGGRDPEKTFAQEEKIRKEWQGRSKVYSELQGTFNNIKASADTGNGPGDIALITSFMKMLDPGSVVRETEFATARDTAGLFTQLENRLQKAKNGELLGPAQRAEYVALSKKYLDSAQKKADQEKKDLGIVVKNYRLNPENVFGAEQAPPPPLPTSATVGGVTYPRPAGFTDAQWRDYLKANGVIQ
jgi:hypothetical protein